MLNMKSRPRESWAVFLSCILVRMKYVHPDYVIGEPIPEVEPRVNEEVLVAARALTRRRVWFLVVYVVVLIASGFVPMGFGVRLGVAVVGLAVWCGMYWRFRKPMLMREKDQWCIPFRDESRYEMVSVVGTMMLAVSMSVGGEISQLVGWAGIVFFLVGLVWVTNVVRGREPGQMSCKGCSYSLVGLTIPCDCPECGVRIYSVEETTDRPRVSLLGLRWIGVGMMVAGLAIMWTGFFQPGAMYGQMPRSALLGLAATDEKAFVEVIGLPMTQAERSALIDGLIAEDVRNGVWSRYSYEQRDWLRQCLSDGSMSKAQLGRMLDGYADEGVIGIDAPAKGRVGEEMTVRLLGKRVGSPFRPQYYFRGYRIGDDPALYAGSVYPRSFFKVTKGGRKHYSGTSGYDSEPVYALVPTEPGEVIVRGQVVFTLIRGAQYNTLIDWEKPVEEGFEAGKELLWHHVVELEHRILVEP